MACRNKCNSIWMPAFLNKIWLAKTLNWRPPQMLEKSPKINSKRAILQIRKKIDFAAHLKMGSLWERSIIWSQMRIWCLKRLSLRPLTPFTVSQITIKRQQLRNRILRRKKEVLRVFAQHPRNKETRERREGPQRKYCRSLVKSKNKSKHKFCKLEPMSRIKSL